MKAYNIENMQKRTSGLPSKIFIKKVIDLLAPLKKSEALSTRQIASAIFDMPVDSEDLNCTLWDSPILQPLNSLVANKRLVKVKVKGINCDLFKLSDFEYKRLHKETSK